MTEVEIESVREYSAAATTEDLLDRVTAFRADHDPAAIHLFERELSHRGVDRTEIERRQEEVRETVLTRENGSAVRCGFCERPAEDRIWAWFRLWGKVPLFPRPVAVCGGHLTGRN